MNTNTSNIWFRRFCSLIGAAYFVLIGYFSYLTFFYDVSVTNKVSFCLLFSVASLVALVAMLYSRFQILTRILSILLLPLLLPILLLCFGEWVFIIPIAVTAVTVFFLSGAHSGVKTVFGIIYMLLFILGSLAFFMIASFFSTNTTSTVLDSSVSPSGAYRCEIVETPDSSGGSLKVLVEPNDKDIKFPYLTFLAKGYDHTVSLTRPIPDSTGTLEWTTGKREDITAYLLSISGNVTLDLTDTQKTLIGIDPETEEVYLRDISDAQLELLGVPEESDILIYNDEIVFRGYIAEAEDYFSIENRTFSLLS